MGNKGYLWYVMVNTESTLRLTMWFSIQSASRVHCNIAYGELVINFPESQIKDTIDTLMLTLMDILKDVPLIDFDECLSWQGAHGNWNKYFMSDPNSIL